MKKLTQKVVLIVLCAHKTLESSISVINSTSGQNSITIQTAKNSTINPVFPNENQYLNDINNPNPTPTMISYDGNPITKLVITRLSTNMPQIIYYDNDEKTSNQSLGGLYTLNTTQQGTMRVWPDYVDINNIPYQLVDLSSYIKRSNKLRKNLSPTNIDETQKGIDDLISSIKLVQESDKASQLDTQISIIQAGINVVSHNIEIMTTLNKNLENIQDLQKNLSSSTINQAEQTLQNLWDGLQTIMESGLNGELYNQAQALHSSMNKLQEALKQAKTQQQAVNTEILVS